MFFSMSTLVNRFFTPEDWIYVSKAGKHAKCVGNAYANHERLAKMADDKMNNKDICNGL